ncbi:MAG: UDP-2,3-diacylglucosamine diphosphatase [Planctomycetes bacterium]|nr:UDP-2,3-diacylglucosamine diphosphatase [Planctomycetota bacterium]
MANKADKTHYRSIWISDVHLGTKACRAERLIEFLQSTRCDHLYLVGDIIDIWALKRKWHWPAAHSDVIRRILKRDIKGTRVTFVPGNHDEAFRDYAGLHFGGVEIINEAVHTTADGKRVLIVHGDAFDAIVKNYTLITHIGDWLYDLLLWANIGFNRVRRWLGFGYWSLAAYIKQKVKMMITFVSSYEDSLVRYAKQHKADVIISGHIHRPEVKQVGEVLYANCGDWVENCSALVEHADGRIELVKLGLHEEAPAVAAAQPQAEAEPAIPAGALIEPEPVLARASLRKTINTLACALAADGVDTMDLSKADADSSRLDAADNKARESDGELVAV